MVPKTAAAPPPAATDENVVGDRVRLLGIGMAALFGGCVLFAALRLFVHLTTGRATPWWGNAGAALVVAVLYLWLRKDPRHSSIVVHLTALTGTVAMTIPAFYGMTSSKWWLSLVGFAVLLMGSRREGIVWMAITTVLVPTLALVEGSIGVPNAVGEPPAERAMAGLFFVIILLGVTAAFRRVAERRARELFETAASLRRANAVKSRFLAHMSHEIRTPLHGVLAMTDMAMEGEASPGVKDQIHTARGSARVLLELLNNVLDVARAESDALEIAALSFKLHAALADVLVPLSAQARAKGLTFIAQADAGIVEQRVGDRARVQQILLNLVGNALKFTREGSIVVRLCAAAGDEDKIVLTVEDTGPGVPAHKLGKIFEPFVQAHFADTHEQAGTGLGLAIVRELAQRMGGRVDVESVAGHGSTFRVELRLARGGPPREAGAEDLLARPAERPSDPQARATQPLSVLVCEDNAVNRTVLLAMLRRLGYGAAVAADGLAAWELAKAERFDLLITDVEVPGIDGLELARRVRAREREHSEPRMAIIGATAHVGESDQQRLLDAGMDLHLAKPFGIDALTRAIASVTTERSGTDRAHPAAASTTSGGARAPAQEVE